MKTDLKTVTAIVKEVLEGSEQARDSDNILIAMVLDYYAKAQGVDLQHMSIVTFLYEMEYMNLPKFETIRRTRQKVQEKCPDLQSSERVKAGRNQAQREYVDYARSDAPWN